MILNLLKGVIMLHSSEILKDAWTFGGDLLKFLAICGQKYEVKLHQICFQNKIKKNKKKLKSGCFETCEVKISFFVI